jgi:hypothetical protein
MASVVEYHIYLIGEDGFIVRRVDLFCSDDGAARRQAEQLVDGHDVELWRNASMIATFAASR